MDPDATTPSPVPIDLTDRDAILHFLEEAERLKDVLRSAHSASGRCESTAEHSWRLCLWAMSLSPWLPNLDTDRLLRLCVLHDLGEALHGDTPATEQADDPHKSAREAADFDTLTGGLPTTLRQEFRALWREYEDAATPEARLAKGIDKLETVLQHVQGKNPDGFDYAFNLSYGRRWTDADPLLHAMRKPIDAATARRAEGETIERRDGRRSSLSTDTTP